MRNKVLDFLAFNSFISLILKPLTSHFNTLIDNIFSKDP